MKKNILFLARWYPHRYDPMFGLFVQRHAEAVAGYHDVSVVYIHQDQQLHERDELIQTVENGVNTIRVYYRKPNTAGLLSRTLSLFRFFMAVRKGMKVVQRTAGTPDLIHVHILTRLGVVAMFYRLIYHIPYLITEHWSRYLPANNGFQGFLRKRITALVISRAGMITTVTENLANAMRSHGLHNDRYTILPNVVDMQLFKPLADKNNSPVKIVHVSCFEDQSKNISGMLHVLHRLKQSGVQFECAMVGEGVDFDRLESLRNTLNLADCVRFSGLLQGKELANEIGSADFMLMFSHYENMPVVILEAFACGIPVIATKVGGIPEMVDETNGILVDAGDQNGLLRAIQEMISRVHDFNPTSLRGKVEQKYGTQQVGALINSWYNELFADL